MSTIVFLHIPKTAGQTVHQELARVVGQDAVSPVRVHSQAAPDAQMPPGYRLYSGHIDWTDLETLPEDRFVFTVLRDPLERIASFYFYLLSQAQKLDAGELAAPSRTGMRMITSLSAEDYFFGGEKGWQTFIHDHYDNFYCSYFATRKMRGWRDIAVLSPRALVNRAFEATRAIDGIYATTDLARLEADLHARTGAQMQIADRYVNVGPETGSALRWPKLADRLGSDAAIRRLEGYAERDRELMERLDRAGRLAGPAPMTSPSDTAPSDTPPSGTAPSDTTAPHAEPAQRRRTAGPALSGSGSAAGKAPARPVIDLGDGAGLMLLPATGAERVRLLVFHGGGGVSGSPDQIAPLCSLIARDGGIAVALVRYRTLGRDGAGLEAQVADASRALDRVRADLPDGSTLDVLGAASGGFLALDAVRRNPAGVRRLVLLNPVTDTGPDGFSNKVFQGPVAADLSPVVRWADDPALQQTECLILHGRLDAIVPIGASRRFAALWPDDRCHFVEYPHSGTGFFNRTPHDESVAAQVRSFLLDGSLP